MGNFSFEPQEDTKDSSEFIRISEELRDLLRKVQEIEKDNIEMCLDYRITEVLLSLKQPLKESIEEYILNLKTKYNL